MLLPGGCYQGDALHIKVAILGAYTSEHIPAPQPTEACSTGCRQSSREQQWGTCSISSDATIMYLLLTDPMTLIFRLASPHILVVCYTNSVEYSHYCYALE